MADILGVSSVVALQNNQDPHGESPAALLGPFWRANSPACKPGDNIARSGTPGIPLAVTGTVRDAKGQPMVESRSTCGRPRPSASMKTRTRRRKT